MAFSDSAGQKYLALTGYAELLNDRDRIRELWSIPTKAWWSGPVDPYIRLLKIKPRDAQYWDSPGTVASYIKMIAAAVSDARPAIGGHAKVRM